MLLSVRTADVLVPPYVTALSAGPLALFVVTYQRAVTAAPGAAASSGHLADTLRTVAATPTGQLSYCPRCQVSQHTLS